MEVSEISVQTLSEDGKKPGKTKRSQADKVGKLKYLLQKDRELAQELGEIKLMLRTIFEGLKPSFNFKRPLLEKIPARTRSIGKFSRRFLNLDLLACCPRI
jgi:hypothetical protein